LKKIYYSNPTLSQCMEKMHCVVYFQILLDKAAYFNNNGGILFR
jgi:hypothetical protein